MGIKFIYKTDEILKNEKLLESFKKEFSKYFDECQKFNLIDLSDTTYETLLNLAENEKTVMIAKRNKCIGFINYTENNSENIEKFRSYCHVNFIYVKKSFRNKGYGKKLMNQINQKKYDITLYCQPQNKKAQGFYEHLGFMNLGKADDYLDSYLNLCVE